MELKERFFGKGTPEPGGPPVANPVLTDPPSFQLLYAAALDIDSEALTQSLRDYHPELAQATAEIVKVPAPPPLPEGVASPSGILGLIGWGKHVIKVVGFNAPMPSSVLDRTVQVAHYSPEWKETAYQHTAHILLYYAGYESDVLEQHVALAASAAALAQFGAIVVMNETANTSVPAPVLLPHEEDGGDTLQAMRGLPLTLLYAGMVVIEPDDGSGLWVRTYGCHVFRLPDLAIRPAADDQGPEIFNLFASTLAYLRENGKTILPGEAFQASDGRYFRFREPTRDEWFLDSEGRMLVVETISAEEANPP